MKRTIIVFSILFLLASAVYAGPFGLEMGMTFDQVKSACDGRTPRLLKEDYYEVIPSKVHSSFDTYIVCIDKEFGLYFIKAIGPDITSSSYGIEVKTQFNKVKDSLTNNYGEGNMIDVLLPGSLWDNDNEWILSLSYNQRYFMCNWDKAECQKMSENLSSIVLAAKASDVYTGHIVLEYYFTNSAAVEARQKAAEDSAL